MTLGRLEITLKRQLNELEKKGTLKGRETVISGLKPGNDGLGPRYYLAGHGDKEFLRMNSNSYLGLSFDQKVIQAEEEAVQKFGTGPGAVRFISGTFQPHVKLETKLARFHEREAAMIFSSAYAAVMGILPPLISPQTIVISDELNHNCIINAVKLSRPAAKEIYHHLDVTDLEEKLKKSVGRGERVIVVTDGIFSMRGDSAPLSEIVRVCQRYQDDFPEGVITVVDDSHGVGAYGESGRGTEEYTKAEADILVATLGKALGVNGGYVVAGATVVDYLRETSPFYIYSNPITAAEAAAAHASLEIIDSEVGRRLLAKVFQLTKRLEQGLVSLGFEVIQSDHPIVPLMTRDTLKTEKLIAFLFDQGILATGIKFPVVPRGDEEIRFQVSANHSKEDIDLVLQALHSFKPS